MKTEDQTHPISHKNKNIDRIFSFRKKIAYKHDRQNILGSSAVLNRKLKEKKRNHSLPEEIALVQQKKKKN